MNYWYNDYYRAIHSKTNILANLTEKMDNIGAALNSDVISQYALNGSITKIDNLKNHMELLNATQTENKTKILSYNTIYQKYAKEYIDSQLRFYKNIYKFREYFYSKNAFAADGSNIYNYIFTLDSDKYIFDNASIGLKNCPKNPSEEFIKLNTFYDSENGNSQVEIVDDSEDCYVRIKDKSKYQSYSGGYKPYYKYFKIDGEEFVPVDKKDLVNKYLTRDDVDTSRYFIKTEDYGRIGYINIKNHIDLLPSLSYGEIKEDDKTIGNYNQYSMAMSLLPNREMSTDIMDVANVWNYLKAEYVPFTEEYRPFVGETFSKDDNIQFPTKNYEMREYPIVTKDNAQSYYHLSLKPLNKKIKSLKDKKIIWYATANPMIAAIVLNTDGTVKNLKQYKSLAKSYPTYQTIDLIEDDSKKYNLYYYSKTQEGNSDDYLLSAFNIMVDGFNSSDPTDQLRHHYYKKKFYNMVNNELAETIKAPLKLLFERVEKPGEGYLFTKLRDKSGFDIYEDILLPQFAYDVEFNKDKHSSVRDILQDILEEGFGFETDFIPIGNKGFYYITSEANEVNAYCAVIYESDFAETPITNEYFKTEDKFDYYGYDIYDNLTKELATFDVDDFISDEDEIYILKNWDDEGYRQATPDDIKSKMQLYKKENNFFYPVYTLENFKAIVESDETRFKYYSQNSFNKTTISTTPIKEIDFKIKNISYVKSTKNYILINLQDVNIDSIRKQVKINLINKEDETIKKTITGKTLSISKVEGVFSIYISVDKDYSGKEEEEPGYKVDSIWGIGDTKTYYVDENGYEFSSKTITRPQITQDSKTYSFSLRDIEWSNLNKMSSSTTITVLDENGEEQDIETIEIIGKYDKQDVSKYTNGEFWYWYKEDSNNPALQEHAAIIECQLTEYWTQAYNASLYTDYMIPEFWQNTKDGKNNSFNDDIIYHTINSSRIGSGEVKILSTLVPEIVAVEESNSTRVQKYNLYYIPADNDPQNLDLSLITKENSISAKDAFKDNQAMLGIFKRLEQLSGESIDNWRCEVLTGIKTTYYYPTSGGTKWTEVLSKFAPMFTSFGGVDGWYPMFIKYFSRQYEDRDISGYLKAKNDQRIIWNEIYTNYPGLVLESQYSNENATTSTELFTLASYAFKDLSYPERKYNISVIDINSLKGYYGQELKVSDSILLNVGDYTDQYDDLRTAISQHLYISDISYTLRKDDDIQLTVNTVKYQDKMIKKLARLIR